MTDTRNIVVVICTYNRAAYITDALESLYQQTLAAHAFEVIVVNNNSTDDTASRCQDYMAAHPSMNIQFFNEPQQGASFARNSGAAKATAPLLCFMDDDAVASKDYLEKIVAFFNTHPQAVGLGGRIIPRYIPAEPAWMSYYVSSLVGNFDYAPRPVVFQPGKYPLESNMIVRKKDFDAVGGFNTALPGVVGLLRIGGEGKEFFYKLQALGHPIYYDPAILVHHVVEVNKLTREYRYRVASGMGRGERVRVLAKGKWALWMKLGEYIFKLGASLVLAVKYTLQGTPSKALPVVHFRIDALKGLLQF